MSQHERHLEQWLLRDNTGIGRAVIESIRTRQEQGSRTRQKQQEMFVEDLNLLRETIAIIEPKGVRVHIHTQLDLKDRSIIVHCIDMYDEHDHLLPCQSQDVDNWRDCLSAHYIGTMLHCLYEEVACGDHQFYLKENQRSEDCIMIPSSSDQNKIEFFGNYMHTIRFRSIDDVNRCIPIILSILGEGVEDVPLVEDKEHGGFTVDLITNERLDEAQAASIQQVEGVLSCACNEDMHESGVAGL